MIQNVFFSVFFFFFQIFSTPPLADFYGEIRLYEDIEFNGKMEFYGKIMGFGKFESIISEFLPNLRDEGAPGGKEGQESGKSCFP